MRNSFNLVFVILIFMVLGCVCGGNKRTSNNSVNLNKPTNIDSNVLLSVTPRPDTLELDRTSPAWKQGYKVGLKEGRETDNPQKIYFPDFKVMVRGAAEIHKPKDPENWKGGYEVGFFKSYYLCGNSMCRK